MADPKDPRIWGPVLWSAMQFVAEGFDPTNLAKIEDVARFYESLRGAIPCASCGANYAELLARIPVRLYLTSREGLFNWIAIIREQVNLHIAATRSVSNNSVFSGVSNPIPIPVQQSVTRTRRYRTSSSSEAPQTTRQSIAKEKALRAIKNFPALNYQQCGC
jgi:hypothetical protein